MKNPVRLQLSRKKGFNLQQHSRSTNGLEAVKVDRTTAWGNDFSVTEHRNAESCVDLFEHDLDKFECFHPEQYAQWIKPLIGKNLACWCKPGSPCHADVLLRRAAEYETLVCQGAE